MMIRARKTKANALDRVGDNGEVLRALAATGKVEDKWRVIAPAR